MPRGVYIRKAAPQKEDEGERVLDLIGEHGWLSKKALAHVGVHKNTFWGWVKSDPDFRDRYEQARVSQAHMLAEEAIEIGDEETFTMEQVQRNKLRSDNRKWYVSKIAPLIFGDRIHHSHTHRHGVVILPPIQLPPIQNQNTTQIPEIPAPASRALGPALDRITSDTSETETDGSEPDHTEHQCNWYGGCIQLATTEDLCPFHFDACERTEHAQKQRDYEQYQRAPFVPDDPHVSESNAPARHDVRPRVGSHVPPEIAALPDGGPDA